MSHSRTAFVHRASMMLAVVLSVLVVGSSLATAADLTTTAAPTAKPKVIPPIVSPRTDQTPQTPAGSQSAAGQDTAALTPPVPVTSSPASPPAAPGRPQVIPGQPKVPQGFVAGQSVEEVSKRTEYAKTFRNPDGSFTAQISATPKHYRSGTGWADIDNGLVADPAGGFRNRANAFAARFQSSGIRVETPQGTVTMSPTGRALPAPTVDPTGQTVTYSDVWGPGVDLRYRVIDTGVKEEIVFRQRPTMSEFAFTVEGVSLSPQPDGSLAAGGAFAGKWGVDAPTVFGRDGAPLPAAAPRFSVADSTVTLAVDSAWLASLKPADLPVVVDPTFPVDGVST